MLEEIRKKPESDKMKILIVSTIITMMFILSIWGVSVKREELKKISNEELQVASVSIFKLLREKSKGIDIDSFKGLMESKQTYSGSE